MEADAKLTRENGNCDHKENFNGIVGIIHLKG